MKLLILSIKDQKKNEVSKELKTVLTQILWELSNESYQKISEIINEEIKEYIEICNVPPQLRRNICNYIFTEIDREISQKVQDYIIQTISKFYNIKIIKDYDY